jgi:hypothetical protein
MIKDEKLFDMILTNKSNLISIVSNFVYDNEFDMIRGDLVSITKYDLNKQYMIFGPKIKIFIFDGIRLIDLNKDETKLSTLPQKFHVIKDDAPIKYWYNDQLRKWCIFDIYGVWFDHSPVKLECLNNIKYGLLFDSNSNYGVYTHFNYNNKKYYIVCDYLSYDDSEWGEHINVFNFEIEDDDIKTYILDKFKRLLNSDNVNFITNNTFTSNENTLIIQI